MITLTVSTKNQITIPRYILEVLNVEKQNKMLLTYNDVEIKLKPIGKSIVDSLTGSVKIPKNKRGIPFEKVLKETKKIVAKKLAES